MLYDFLLALDYMEIACVYFINIVYLSIYVRRVMIVGIPK